MKMKNILIFLLLLIPLSCSTTNIDLKKIDIEWKHEFDFYIDYHDGLLIVDDTLLLTHYSRKTDRETLKSAYFESIYKFDKNSGEIMDYKFINDSLTSKDIFWSEKFHRFANRSTWPKEFNMESAYDINIEIDKSGPIHHEKLSYTLEIFKNEEKYNICLDEFGEIRIEYYLKYSNELYLWLYQDDDDHNNGVRSVLYKFNIDDLIRKYR